MPLQVQDFACRVLYATLRRALELEEGGAMSLGTIASHMQEEKADHYSQPTYVIKPGFSEQMAQQVCASWGGVGGHSYATKLAWLLGMLAQQLCKAGPAGRVYSGPQAQPFSISRLCTYAQVRHPLPAHSFIPTRPARGVIGQ